MESILKSIKKKKIPINPAVVISNKANAKGLKIAKKLIDIAVDSGADAVKFQLFDGKVLYPNNKKMRKLFEKNQLNSDWIPILKKYCIKNYIN